MHEWVCSFHGRMAKLGHSMDEPCKDCDVPPVLAAFEIRIRPAKLPDFYRDRQQQCWLCRRPGQNRMVEATLADGRSKVPVCAEARECRVETETVTFAGWLNRGNWVRGVRERGPYYQVGTDVEDSVDAFTFREPDGRHHSFSRRAHLVRVTGRRPHPAAR